MPTNPRGATPMIVNRRDPICTFDPMMSRPAAELRLPRRVACDRDGRALGRLVFGVREVPADRWRRVEEAEEARGDDADVHLARGVADADREIVERERRRVRENACDHRARSAVARTDSAGTRARCRETSSPRTRGATVAGSCIIGGGRNSSRSTIPNIAAFAPMPRARVTMTAEAKPGFDRRPRSA